MRKAALLVVLVTTAAEPARAQEPAAVYQTQPAHGFRFAGDGLARYEWTRDIPSVDGTLSNSDRYRFQARPRLELNVGPFEAGVGGEFNYSGDENDEAPDGGEPALIRDNYRSRDARVDLAYGRLKVGPVIAQGGRFLMPVPLTEMIWDRDLRPQGGAVTIGFGSSTRFAATGLYTKGSHVFEDESVVMYGGAADLTIATGAQSNLELTGSYLRWEDLAKLTPSIWRQNSTLLLFASDYKVVDVVARLSSGGGLVTLVADYCWNTALDDHNRGLWLSAILGRIGTSRLRAEYTYAKVDRDATVAAYNTDDFFWATGWEGHRVDLGTGAVSSSSLHLVGQWQRFKDSPSELVSGQWVSRIRAEWRTSF